MSKTIRYADILREISDTKRKIQLIEAERKAIEDENREEKKKNGERVAGLKKSVLELTREMAALSKMSQAENILLILDEYDIDTTKYKNKTAPEILRDIDVRISNLVKSADSVKHQTVQVYKKTEQLRKACWNLHRNNEKVKAGDKTTPSAQSQAKGKVVSEVQGVYQKMREAEHIQRQYRSILDAARTETITYEHQLLEIEKEIAKYEEESVKLKKMREAARRARDAAKSELLRLEETLMASTRETDRILSEYKRYVEESKMAGAGEKTSRRGTNNDNNGDSGVVWPSPQMDSDRAETDLSMAFTADMKLSFDKLKSVTGASDAKSAVDIILSQREKCLQLKHQLNALDERFSAICSPKDTTAAAAAVMALNKDHTQPLIDLKFDKDDPRSQLERITETRPQSESQQSSSMDDIVLIIKKICAKISVDGPSEDVPQTGSVAELLELCEAKILALADHLKNPELPGKSSNTEITFEYVTNLSLPVTPRMDTDSVGRSPVPTENPEGGRKSRAGESESDEGEVPTRGFLKRQSRLIVEARVKKHTQRSRKGLD